MRKLLLSMLILLGLITSCKSEKSYKVEAVNISNEILKISVISEQICSLYSLAWQNAINKEGGYYDKTSPYYLKDFNEAISVVQGTKEVQVSIDSLKVWEENIENRIGEINKYPDNLSQLKNEIIEAYSTAKNYSRLAQEPKGSLMTFNQEVNNLSSKSKELYDKVQILSK